MDYREAAKPCLGANLMHLARRIVVLVREAVGDVHRLVFVSRRWLSKTSCCAHWAHGQTEEVLGGIPAAADVERDKASGFVHTGPPDL